jgi:hypothetical protein
VEPSAQKLGRYASSRLSAAELLAAKNTRPIQSLDDLAADIFESDEELESSWLSPTPSATATSPDPCRAASHPRHRRRLVTTGGSSPGRWPRA